jgi:PAS domain S-box-containing protein
LARVGATTSAPPGRPRPLLWLVVALAFCLGCLDGRAQDRPRRVLLLYPYDDMLPATTIAGAAMRKRLQERSTAPIEFYTDFLDLARFSTEADELRTAHYLAEKYAKTPIDIVMSLGIGGQRFVNTYRPLITPNVPIVFCCGTAADVAAMDRPANITGVYSELDLAKTLLLAERLQPEARDVVVISGSSGFDRRLLERIRKEFEPYEKRFDTKYWIGVPYAALLERAAKLPRETIIIYTSVFADDTGRIFTPVQVAEDLAKAAGAPMYGPADTYLGRGIVGGYMDTYENSGIAAADLALEILAGADPSTIAPRPTNTNAFRVDARQLQRWGLSESNLPPDTVISFKEPTLWAQHRMPILSAVGVIAFEAALIAALLIQFLRRRRAEGSLKESEERWRSVFETSAAGVALMDGNAGFVATNTAFQSMLGYAGTELRGLSLVDLSTAEDRASSRQLLDELRQGTLRHYDAVKQFQRKNGTPVWGHIYASTILGNDAKPRLFVATMIDITARKLAEDAMRIAQSELAQVARLTTMGEMAASIAHEINQPLAAIVANGNAGLRWLANATPDIDEVRATLKRIVSDGHRAGRVIGGVRTMFKKSSQARAAVDINDLVREVLTLVRGELDNRMVTVRTELEQLPQVLVDRVQLQQVILNLITNAIDAMASVDGRPRVLRLRSERHQPGGVMLTVQDSGTGIDKKDMNRIFLPFFTTKSHGMGMGLAICRSVVEAHGGRLTASHGHPCGAVFQVILPIREPGTESAGLAAGDIIRSVEMAPR